MKKLMFCTAVLAMAGFVFASGCAEPDTTGDAGTTAGQPAGDDHDHDHSHGEHGPRGGLLIELGHQHEFHAELVEDAAAGTVTLFVMDHDLKPVTGEVSTVSLVVTDGGATKTYDLEASGAGENAGYSLTDSQLLEMLKKPEIKGKLRVTIDGIPYSGDFSHEAHDHGDDHDHEHEGDDHDHEAPAGDG